MSPFETRKYTTSQVRKAGEILKKEYPLLSQAGRDALEVLQNYRALFNLPLNRFNASLRIRLKREKINAELVAQRIKRLPSIIFKLLRLDGMQLNRMQDIGGIRVVLSDMKALETLYRSYTEARQRRGRPFRHELIRHDDYISHPKDSGYRGYHLVFRYHPADEFLKDYDGLAIEMQLRTKLQHIWATAVETFEVYLGEQFKASKGDANWLEFFALLSSSFALEEKQEPAHAHLEMTKEQIHQAIREKAAQLDALKLISTFSLISHSLPLSKDTEPAYYVLIFDAKEKDSFVRVFKSYEQAYLIYSNEEERSKDDPARQVVLVRSDSVKKLPKAYPNYFANLKELQTRLEHIIRTGN